MIRPRILILNLVLVFIITFVQNTSAKAPFYIDLSKTLGFIIGQNFSLDRIKVEYPALSLQVISAKLEFNNTFGIAEKNIEKEVKDFLKDKYSDYIKEMKRQINTTLKSQPITQDTALKFLEDVKSRAKGEIPSPFLETLLHYQFKKQPVNEFVYDFKRIYRTKGHRKAKGLDLQIEYPQSWSKREGNRPNIIQFFISNNGRGLTFASIMVKDLIKEAQGQLTHEEIKSIKTLEGSKELALEVFSENSLREIATGMGIVNIRNINTKKGIVIDRWPGAMLEFIGEQQRLDRTITMYNRMYIAIYKNYIIFLQFQIGKLPNETDDTLKIKISKYLPLFRLVANSLVIQSQY